MYNSDGGKKMILDEWLWRNNVSMREFSQSTGISYNVVQPLKTKKRQINLLNAMRIVKFTGGQVTLEDLLMDTQKKQLQKINPHRKTNNEENSSNISRSVSL